ncbi:MAG: glycoside hydrolase family 92 protein, partial [Ignavibacteria bacterium]|nr:glycoside hydrolase family 92 protein [Ignavibacteria bacterium]
IDLREINIIFQVTSSFLRDINSYIFLPSSVEYSFSEDGKNFSIPLEIKNGTAQNVKEKISKPFLCEPGKVNARFIRVRARNIGVCPEWHKGAGDKAWLFVDEIEVK